MKTESLQALLIFVVAFVFLNTRWSVFSQIDSFFWIIADGNWKLVDLIKYLVASLVLIVGAIAIGGVKDFPRPILYGWIIYCVATAFANLWSLKAGYSWKVWGLDAVLPGAAMLFAASVTRAAPYSAMQYQRIAAVVVLVLGLYSLLNAEDFMSVFDPVLFSTILSFLLPLGLIGLVACSDKYLKFYILFLVFILILILCLQIRIIHLVFPLMCFCVIAMVRKDAGYKKRVIAILLLSIFSLLLYRYSSMFKPADWRMVMNETTLSTEGSWWQVFFKTERYKIWQFWIEQGMKSPWVGVGMGWEVPSQTYAGFRPANMLPIFVSHGHNVFMNRFLQSGIIGLTGLVIWLGTVLYVVKHNFKDANAVTHFPKLFLVLMIILFVFRNLPDDGMRGLNVVLFWLSMGAGIGCFKSNQA
ncbi:hypothetical protein LIN78_11065 [Leeia sp. TBRC 13508]|uniref:O-antigen ligase-related domain-containing protein n=1 Tax=Leeia speluncae TaxID=2884804 RepID=A0ABS8D7A5_9NEIS|nr:O-antigen ligase family protein [Leeia speluncae]MCB6184085.1 hypothetical protein [Leeia speluncae]